MEVSTCMEIIRRNAVSVFMPDTLEEKLKSGKRLRVKFGADPSRPDLHLGHTVPFRMLKLLQDAGHEIVFVIGDFTGMIGDPSGRSKTRKPLSFEETRTNARTYLEQVSKLLDKNKTTITYNSEWLSAMNFEDVLKLAGHYTLARILERDDFAKRFADNQPIGLHELFYPLVQGYDSVELHSDIEIGGTDQTFNLLVGRQLQRDCGQPEQEVITFPLLPGLDGVEKMSKSLDNYIGIDEPPAVMFEKCMRVPDSVLEQYFRLTTDLPEHEYTQLLSSDMRKAHRVYACEIVRMYHGIEAVMSAEERYNAVAAGGVPEDIPVIKIDEQEIPIVMLLVKAGLADSGGDARRLVTGGGIRVDGERMSDPFLILKAPAEFIIGRGKNRFVKVIMGS